MGLSMPSRRHLKEVLKVLSSHPRCNLSMSFNHWNKEFDETGMSGQTLGSWLCCIVHVIFGKTTPSSGPLRLNGDSPTSGCCGLLKLQPAGPHSRASDAKDLGWGPGIGISNSFPDAAAAAGPGPPPRKSLIGDLGSLPLGEVPGERGREGER